MAPLKHHPQGPSQQKSFAICCGYQPTVSTHQNTYFGIVGHEVWDTGNRQLVDKLSDPDFALSLVDRLEEAWWAVVDEFVGEFGGITHTQNEVFLEAPGLNYGTMDRLRIAGYAALIGDGKFGRWRVDHAQYNLQGHNYAVLVWANYPQVEDLWVWFGNPRLEQYTLAKFTRREHYKQFASALAQRLKDAANPDPKNFHWDDLNCSFCRRLDCPVRLDVATLAADYINRHQPLEDMKNEDLVHIRKITSSLKTFIKLVDDETKTRILDNGEALPGYEAKEKVRSREVIGEDNVRRLRVLLRNNLVDADYEVLEEGLWNLVTVSWSDVEQLIVHAVGGYREAKPIITKLLNEMDAAHALTTNRYYTVVAANEDEK